MPLNPPSYSGQDVWFSPDVFANKSEVALWQPPQARESPSDPALQAWVNGDELANDGTAEGGNAAAAYRLRLLQDGIITQQQFDEGQGVAPNGANQSSGGNIPNIAPFATDTQGVENLSRFPPTLQLSRNFTLGQMTLRPWVSFEHPVPPGGHAGLTQGQLVANLKLLALNVLDPIKDRYPDMFCTCTFRNQPAGATSQHPRGQAADLQFSRTPKSRYYDIAVWIKDNVPFDQMLLEYVTSPSSWIHISFNPQGNRPASHPVKIGTMVNHSFVARGQLTNMAPQLRLP